MLKRWSAIWLCCTVPLAPHHSPLLPITVPSFPSLCTYLGGLPAVQVPGSVGTAWYGPGIGPTLMNNVAWTASHPPGDKLKWKALCGHLMPADYVIFIFGFVHVWWCHKFVCLCIKCVVEGQRAERCNSGLCGFICTTYLIRRVISCGFYVNFSHL